jgi:ribosomal protein L11 methyltransferase
MKNRLIGTTDDDGARTPSEHLYVYHLEGRVAPTYSPERSDFIGLWQESDSAFLFFSSPAPGTIAELVRSDSGLTCLDSYHLTYDQWHGGRFNAFRQGALHVVPAWQANKRDRDQSPSLKTILLDPGVVFGVGTHPTTRDCLAALQLAFQDNRFVSALDLGTGTGLLALAAARLGGTHVMAVDLNALAAKTAQANVRLNQLEDYVMVIQGNAMDLVHCRADLVIANIHYDVMRRLIQSRAFLEKKHFVLSGLMRREAKDIAGELRRRAIEIIHDWQHDGTWFTFYARRR